MRDLTKIKAEIFRRSNEKIKKRKQIRNQTLIVAAVCVCMTLLPVIFIKDDDSHTVEIPSNSAQLQKPTAEATKQHGITVEGQEPTYSNLFFAKLDYNDNQIAVCANKQQIDSLYNKIQYIINNYDKKPYQSSSDGGRMGIYVVSIDQPKGRYGIDISNNMLIDFNNKVSYSIENANKLKEMLELFNIE